MSHDLMERLHEVGDLNDTWAESNLPEVRSQLYVAATAPPPARPRRFAVPATVAALALVAVVATSLVTAGDQDGDSTSQAPATQPAEEEGEVAAPERLSGEMPDGTSWSVEIAVDPEDVCFEVGPSHGCGIAPAFTVIDVSRGHLLVYGLNQGPVRGGPAPGPGDDQIPARLTDPAIAVELELADGTMVSVEHVGQRVWATTLPPGTQLPRTVVKHWPDGSTARTTNVDSEVAPPPMTEEERRAAMEEARREAERQRQLAEDRSRD